LGVPVIQTTDSSSFIGGVEGGDRYQFGKLVIGWEADMVWGSNNNSTSISSFSPVPGLFTVSRALTADTKWQGTATSTVGIAHDRWLIYGKAGVAWAMYGRRPRCKRNLTFCEAFGCSHVSGL
jgi:opacity protein-like surface antigen